MQPDLTTFRMQTDRAPPGIIHELMANRYTGEAFSSQAFELQRLHLKP